MAALYVLATPIGNLADLSPRAVDILNRVDWIACEDTRHTSILLERYKIGTPTVSYHTHSSLQKIDWLLRQLTAGKDIALVTDAGTPGIADPGGVLVERVHAKNQTLNQPVSIISVPGPSSVSAALSVAGFPADRFLFLGFLPKKKGRQGLLKSLTKLDKALGIETIVFFESPLRIHKTLIDLEVVLTKEAPTKTATICLARELTKKFEEVWRGSLAEAIAKTQSPQKGEFVVVVNLGK